MEAGEVVVADPARPVRSAGGGGQGTGQRQGHESGCDAYPAAPSHLPPRRNVLLSRVAATVSVYRLQPMALKLGLNLGYWGIGPRGSDAVEIVKTVEGLGYDSVWAAESYGSDV